MATLPDQRAGALDGHFMMLSFSLAAVLGVALDLRREPGGWHVPFLRWRPPVRCCWWWRGGMISAGARSPEPGSAQRFLAGLRRAFSCAESLVGLRLALLTLSGMLVIPYVAASRVHSEGMSETELSWFYLVGGAVTLFTRPLFGGSDRYPRAVVYYWLVLLSIVPMVLITHRTGVALAGSWQFRRCSSSL